MSIIIDDVQAIQKYEAAQNYELRIFFFRFVHSLAAHRNTDAFVPAPVVSVLPDPTTEDLQRIVALNLTATSNITLVGGIRSYVDGVAEPLKTLLRREAAALLSNWSIKLSGSVC